MTHIFPYQFAETSFPFGQPVVAFPAVSLPFGQPLCSHVAMHAGNTGLLGGQQGTGQGVGCQGACPQRPDEGRTCCSLREHLPAAQHAQCLLGCIQPEWCVHTDPSFLRFLQFMLVTSAVHAAVPCYAAVYAAAVHAAAVYAAAAHAAAVHAAAVLSPAVHAAAVLSPAVHAAAVLSPAVLSPAVHAAADPVNNPSCACCC